MTIQGKGRILLIEDDRFQRLATETALRKHGFDVRTAGDGQEGFDLALADPPDLVLLDLILPKLNGLGLLKKLKENAVTREVPVMVCSNLGQDGDVEQAKDHGAIGYLAKSSMTLAEMVTRVEAVIAPRRAR